MDHRHGPSGAPGATRQPTPTVVFCFADFTFDARTRELRRHGEPVALSVPARGVLHTLLMQHSRTVTRRELLAQVWSDAVVVEGALRVAVCELRDALGDVASRQAIIQTVRGTGYRFAAACQSLPCSEASHAAPSPSLVGRVHELTVLRRCLDEASSAGRALVLLGPPGVGKSRLAHEGVALARARNFHCAWGHCEPDGSGEPLQPWFQMLRQLLDGVDETQRAEALHAAPLLAHALELSSARPAVEGPDGTSTQHRARSFGELMRMLGVLSSAHPLLLLLEDAHWSDEASLACFAHVSRALPSKRILLIVTCRSTAAREHRALARALQTAAREPFNTSLELAGLSVDDTRTMLESGARAHQDLAQQVHALAHGNPLFTLELARVLSAGGSADAMLKADHVEVRTILGRRIDALESDARRALEAAAILGLSFGLAELLAALGETPSFTLGALDSCLQQGVLIAQEGARFAFAHALIRDVTYTQLPRSERAELHARFAHWLEQRGHFASAAGLAQLAHHFYHAAPLGVAAKAVAYARTAAERAMEKAAYAQAATYLEHALECAELLHDLLPAEKLSLEVARVDALCAAGAAGADTVLSDALAEHADRAVALGRPELLVRATLVYTGQTRAGFVPRRAVGASDARELDLLTRSLQAAGDAATQERVLLLCSLAYSLSYSTDQARRTAVCNEAVSLARQLTVPWLLARALLVKVYADADPSLYSERLAACNELVQVTQKHGLSALELEARITRAVCSLEMADRAAAERDEARAIQLAHELDVPRLHVRAELPELFRAFYRGDLLRAEQLTARCREANEQNAVANMLFMVRTVALLNFRMTNTTEMMQFHERLSAANPTTIAFRCSLASYFASAGRTKEATQLFDTIAHDGFALLPRGLNWLSEMSLLAHTAVSLDDRERAELMFEQLRPYGDRWMFYGGEALPGGPVAHWLTELAITLRRADDANTWLARARALCAKVEAPMFMHYTLLAEARLLLKCSGERAAARAWSLVQEVAAFADQHQLPALRFSALATFRTAGERSVRRQPTASS